MLNPMTRRSFFGRAAVAPVAGMAATPELPKQAWVIVTPNWQYNDEYTYAEGEDVLPKVYFDQHEAEAECQRRCRQFFTTQTPQDFEVCFELYRDGFPEDATEETVTWEQLRNAGFPQPYWVKELEV